MKRVALFILPLFLLCSCSKPQEYEDSSINPNDLMSWLESKPPIGQGEILVAYFSATGNTKPLAEYAAEHFNCDLFEIKPVQPYTADDLDYTNSNSRTTKEQNDSTSRPEISVEVEDMSKYSKIILGYPIWHAQAPKIMYTFVESYDLSFKTILPFCTSGSSGIGSSATNLAKSAPNAAWLEGKRFAAGTDEATFVSWLDTMIQ